MLVWRTLLRTRKMGGDMAQGDDDIVEELLQNLEAQINQIVQGVGEDVE